MAGAPVDCFVAAVSAQSRLGRALDQQQRTGTFTAVAFAPRAYALHLVPVAFVPTQIEDGSRA